MARSLNTRSAVTTLFICLIATAGLFFTFAVPPLQKPDEEAHLIRTLSIAGGHIFCTGTSTNSIPLEQGIVTMMKEVKALKLANHAERKFDLALYNKSFFATKSDLHTQSYIVPAIYCGFPVVPYMPHILGISIGRLLHLNAYLVFFMGRFSMLLIALLWMRWIYKRTPEPFRYGILFLFSLPMFLHQLSSYSYDPVHMLLAASLFSVLISFKQNQNLAIMWIIYVGLLLSKTGGYELLLPLYFLIPRYRIASGMKKYVATTVIFFATLIVVFGVFKLIELQAIAAGATLGKGVNPVSQIMYILTNPAHYVLMLIKSTFHFGIFYLQSLIGILGWLEYGFPHIIYFIYVISFIYIVLRSYIPKESLVSRKKLIALGLILIASYIYIVTIFYLLWNPVGAAITDGIQGRYFLVFIPFIYLFAIQCRQRWADSLKLKFDMPGWVSGGIIIAVAVTCMYSVLYRYYF
jgi:uncharacterized membrane protein